MRTPAASILSVIEVVTRSSLAYADAAERIGSGPLAIYFRQVADRRNHFAANLQAGTSSPSPTAIFPRMGSAPGGMDVEKRELLANLLRNEDTLLFRYSLALSQDVSHALMETLTEQFAAVGDAQERIRDLEAG